MTRRRMMFGTFLIPRSRQWVELVHACPSLESSGVRSVHATTFDQHGNEAASRALPLHERLIDLHAVFPPREDVVMVLNDVSFEMEGKDHPYQYGFLYQGTETATPIHYPLGIVLGLTNLIHFSNTGYFPLSALPSWVTVRLFLGNPSSHASIEPEIMLVSPGGVTTHTIQLPPMGHRTVDLHELAPTLGVEYLVVRGTVKPLVFVAGVHRESGALTFLEHLIETNPTSDSPDPSAAEDPPTCDAMAMSAEGGSVESGPDPKRMLCYCLNLTYGDVMNMWRGGKFGRSSSTRVGSYCTSCRGDLEWLLRKLPLQEAIGSPSDGTIHLKDESE